MGIRGLWSSELWFGAEVPFPGDCLNGNLKEDLVMKDRLGEVKVLKGSGEVSCLIRNLVGDRAFGWKCVSWVVVLVAGVGSRRGKIWQGCHHRIKNFVGIGDDRQLILEGGVGSGEAGVVGNGS